MVSPLKGGRQEWLNWRRKKICASDAPIIMQVSPFLTPHQLWSQKVSGEEQEENFAMRRGLDLESRALKCFEQKMNVFLQSQVCLEHKKMPWMACTLDGFDGTTLVEIKCAGKEDHFLAVTEKVPAKYYPQLQHQLEVTGLDGMYYFSFDGKDGVIVEVERDQKYIDKMVLEEEKFWDCIVKMQPPPLTDRDYEPRDQSWVEIAKKRYEVSQQIKELKKQDEELQDALIALSQQRNSTGGGFKFTRTEVTGRVDYEAIPELQGLDLERYRKTPSIQWRLTAI